MYKLFYAPINILSPKPRRYPVLFRETAIIAARLQQISPISTVLAGGYRMYQ